jgi:hypothetical protein
VSVEQALMNHAELTQAVAAACAKALKAGMRRDDVKAVLERLAEVLDGADDE